MVTPTERYLQLFSFDVSESSVSTEPEMERESFSSLLKTSVNEFARKAGNEGRKLLATTCSYVPAPLLSVDGLVPLWMRVPGISGSPMADTYMSSVACPYPRALLEMILDLSVDEIDGWIFATSCDHIRRLADNLSHLEPEKFTYVLDVPHSRDDSHFEWYLDELEKLNFELSDRFEVDTGAEALNRSVLRHNRLRKILRSVGDLRKSPDVRLTGREFHEALLVARNSPIDMIENMYESWSKEVALRPALDGYRARIMVIGSMLDNPEYIGAIERKGGLVVADRFCTGSIPGLEEIEIDDDPLYSIARHWLDKTRCPRMMSDFDLRLSDIIEVAKEYRVDGIIIETMKFCDIWGVESAPLREALREAGYPVLRVESEYGHVNEGQLQTRVQAFIESMGR